MCGNPWDDSSLDEFFQGIFCEEEKIAEARYWVTKSDVNMRKVALTALERTRFEVFWVSKVFRVSFPCHIEDGGLENVGKAEVMRSESAT